MKRTLKALGVAVVTLVVGSVLLGLFFAEAIDVASPVIFVLAVLAGVAWYRWDKPSLGG